MYFLRLSRLAGHISSISSPEQKFVYEFTADLCLDQVALAYAAFRKPLLWTVVSGSVMHKDSKNLVIWSVSVEYLDKVMVGMGSILPDTCVVFCFLWRGDEKLTLLEG